jgi:hypothetical protein
LQKAERERYALECELQQRQGASQQLRQENGELALLNQQLQFQNEDLQERLRLAQAPSLKVRRGRKGPRVAVLSHASLRWLTEGV